MLLVVGPPSPAVVVYEPEFSQLYAYYNIWEEGVQVLGNYVEGGGYCAIYAGVTCTTIAKRRSYQVGTSLYSQDEDSVEDSDGLCSINTIPD